MFTCGRTHPLALVVGAVLAGAIFVDASSLQVPPATPAPGAPQPPATAPGADRPPAAARGPAPSLTRPSSPAKPTDADGFLRRWLVLEPIRTNGQLSDSAVQTLIKTEHFPNQLTVTPRHGDTVTAGDTVLTWHAVDTTNYNVNLYHFAYALNKPTSNVLFWAVAIVHAPRDMPGVRLAIGSNAASVWWLNGEEVIGIYNDRQSVIDDGVSKRVTLKRGPNIVRAAVINGGGATDFCARFLDADDRPITGITVRLDGNATAP